MVSSSEAMPSPHGSTVRLLEEKSAILRDNKHDMVSGSAIMALCERFRTVTEDRRDTDIGRVDSKL